jgi:hypothetical protein
VSVLTEHLDVLVVGVAALWVGAALLTVVILFRAQRRPRTAVDDYCDAVDRELDGLVFEAQVGRGLTAVRSGLDEVGVLADSTWPELVDAGDMLTSDGLGRGSAA